MNNYITIEMQSEYQGVTEYTHNTFLSISFIVIL